MPPETIRLRREFAPEHLSFSALTSYIRCGKAYELRKLAGVPEHPSWWSIGGSCVHQVTEEYDRLDLELTSAGQIVTMNVTSETIRTLDELVDDRRQKSPEPPEEWFAGGRHPDKQRYEYWKEQAPQMVQRWIDWRSEHNWKIAEFGGVPAIEFEVKSPIPGLDVPFIGFIDRVMVLPSGDLVVLDLKTGARQVPEVQLGVYANALEAQGLPRPMYGVYWNARTGKHTPPTPLDKYSSDYVAQHFQQFYTAAKGGTFLPNVYADNCRTCTVQRACYAFGGDLSVQYDPLDPNYVGKAQDG